MAPRKILITGAGGMLGSYAPHAFPGDELVLTDVLPGYSHLDVRQPERVMTAVADSRPDLVLHLAAATDVDRCEQDPDDAYHTNAVGTQNVALACRAHNVPLVYISTAGVFWGDKPEPYIEFDPPRPMNVYGHSKLGGEHIVSSILDRYYIVRAGWMIGGGHLDKKFVGKVSSLVLAGRSPLSVVDDKFGSPTYGKDLLNGINQLLETGYYGLYHMVNQGVCSRYEVAQVLCEALGRGDIELVPVSSAHYPLPAPRARSEAMRNLKLQLLGHDAMPPWQDALRQYVTGELAPALAVPAGRSG